MPSRVDGATIYQDWVGGGDEKHIQTLEFARGKQGGSLRRELDVCVSAPDIQIREL